jgi:hypothetical protein
MLAIQPETRRAYWRVVMHRPAPLRPVNINSPTLPVCDPQIIIDGFAGLIRQLELDGPAGLLLTYCCSVDRIAVRCHVFNLEGNYIAAAEFAIDG